MAEPDPMLLLSDAFDGDPAPFGPRGLLVLRARPTHAFAPEALVCEQGLKPLHEALTRQGRETHAVLPDDLSPPDPAGFPAVAVALTRSRAENRANIARAWALCAPGGRILVAGAKTDGVEALQKALRKEGLEVGATPRRHGRVLSFARPEDPQAPAPDAFAEWLDEAQPAVRFLVEDPKGERGPRPFATSAGVFSWDRPDPGSELLAQTLPPLSGTVADLGAGWGYLSAVALTSPEIQTLHLVEAEHEALENARANLDDPRARFHWADIRALDPLKAQLPRGSCDAVIANPPFHDGREVSLALGEAFLAAAASLLKPNGKLWVVANRTLPYERPLDQLFVESGEVGGDRVYKILFAARPRPKPRTAAKPGARQGRKRG